MEQKVKRVALNPCPHTGVVSPMTNIPHQISAFITVNEQTLTYHHWKSVVYIRFGFGVVLVYSIGFNKFMTHIHQNSITSHYIWNSFTVLKFLCALLVYTTLPTSPGIPFYGPSFSFSTIPYSWNRMVLVLSD